MCVHKINVLLTCELATYCKMHVHACRCAILHVLCGCQRGEIGPNVLSRQPSTPELTCVPINTAVNVLNCSPVSPHSPNTRTHRDTAL